MRKEENLTLQILEAIEDESGVTQRGLARQVGVALGLANSYLKRCVRKGLIKIHQAPANRYLYYLTPQGFAEKSRLTAKYLSYSFTFYRRAGEACAAILADCEAAGWRRIGLCGPSDLAEIAALRSLQFRLEVVCVLALDSSQAGHGEPAAIAAESSLADRPAVASMSERRFLHLPMYSMISACPPVDAWIVTDLTDAGEALRALEHALTPERVLVPDILRVRRNGGPSNSVAGADGASHAVQEPR